MNDTDKLADLEQAARLVAKKLLGWTEERDDIWWTTDAPSTRQLRNLPYLLTGNGMLEIMETLKARKLNAVISAHGFADISPFPQCSPTLAQAHSDKLPEAMLLAAAEALK